MDQTPGLYAVVDVETTGGRLAEDRVIEVAVVLHNGKEILEKYSSLVNPGRPIDPYVSKLTGITAAMVRNAPNFKDIHAEVLRLTSEAVFVAHNVRFDFNILRNEFRRLQISFDCPQADTINLARKAFPGLSSYGLDSVCTALGIHNHGRHRALGDAEATAVLLGMIMEKEEAGRWMHHELQSGLDPDLLPPQLPFAEIVKLPESAGVFFLRNAASELIYMDHGKNLRKAAYKAITGFAKHPDPANPFATAVQIDFEPAPGELIARLLWIERMQQVCPLFSEPLKSINRAFGIRAEADAEGVLDLRLERIAASGGPDYPLEFQSYVSARKALSDLLGKYGIQASRMLLRRAGEEADATFIERHNRQVEKALLTYSFPYRSFLLQGEGLHPGEKSLIWVENNRFRGIGYYMPAEMAGKPTEALIGQIRAMEDHPESRKAIRAHLRKHREQKFIVIEK
jgi:DNA polymerase-3 subunit epsilon